MKVLEPMGNISLAEQLRLIDSELQAGNPGGALEITERCQQQWPEALPISQRLALCYYRLGQKERALQLQRELVSRVPENAEAANRLIAWSVEAGNIPTIRPLLDAWRTRFPDNPLFWLSEIRALHLDGQHGARLAELRRFVLRHPTIEAGWQALLWAEQNSGGDNHLDAAIRAALSALPNSSSIARVALEVSLAAQNLELADLAHESLLRIAPQFDVSEPLLSCRFELLRIVRRYRDGAENGALEDIGALVVRFPNEPGPARRFAEWLGNAGRIAEALSLVEMWRKRLPADAEFALREVQLLREQGDAARAWALCDDLIKNHASLEAAWIERLLLSGQESLRHQWRETAERATALFPGSLRVVQTIYVGAIECDEFDFMSERLKTFLENCQDSLKGYRLAADFYFQQMEYSTSLNVIDAGLSRFSDDYTLLLLRLQGNWRLRLNRESWATWAQALLQHARLTEGGLHVAMFVLLNAGHKAQLRGLLQDIVNNDSLDSSARDIAAKSLSSLTTEAESSRAGHGIIRLDGAVVLNLPPTVRHVVIGFGGLAGGLLSELMQPILKKLGLGSIFLHDRQHVLYLNGVEELADDYEGTLSALRNLLPDSVSTISCFGSSAGGYAALRYAIDLKASSALLFASPTNINADACARDGRARIVAKRIHKVVPHQAANLAETLALSASRLNVHLWYGGAMQQDRDHALNMAGVPGVTLHELADYEGHDVLFHLASSGLLEDAVHQAIVDAERVA